MGNINLVLLSIICVTIISCRTPRYVYSPAPPNNPYFREKGESKLAAYYSTAGNENELQNEYNDGIDIQAAYALSDHFALTADYFKRSEKDAIFEYDRSYFDSSIVRYKRKLTGFGVGYFSPITNDKAITVNAYAGLGFGKYSFTDVGVDNGSHYSRNYSSKITKWYVQPSLNFIGKYLRTALVSRIAWVHYGRASTSYTNAEMQYLGFDLLQDNTLGFVEATWNLQATFKNLEWLYLDGSMTFSSEPFDNSTNLEARNTNFSIGLSLDFSKMKKRK